MKKYMLATILAILLVVSASIAAATLDVSTTSIQFGDKNTEASNPKNDKGDVREVRKSTTFSITNTFNTTLTDIQCVFTLDTEDSDIAGVGDVVDEEEGAQSYLDLSCESIASSITAGNSDSITLNARIPAALDAVDRTDGDEQAFRVARIKVTGKINGSAVQSTQEIFISMQRENNLRIDDVRAQFDGDEESLDDGDKVDDLKPGQSIDVEITAENKYSNNDDVDINDITASFIIDDSDLDVDEDDDIGDISSDDTDSVTLQFDIDDDTPDGSYRADILVIGRDDWGAYMGELWDVTFKVVRKSHEINIQSLTLNPDRITCDRRTVTLATTIQNIGKRDEDSVVVEVIAPELDYTNKASGISLNEDDKTSRSFTIQVGNDVAEGTYPITLKTYWDDSFLSDQNDVLLTVPDCSPKETVTPPPKNDNSGDNVIVQQPPVVQPPVVQPPVQQPPVVQPEPEVITEEVDSNIGIYIAVLVVLIVVLLAVGIFLVIYLTREPQH